MFDTLVRNARIVDGSGNPWFLGDLGIVGDKIDAVGHLAKVEAGRVIDAAQRVVAPGFIDIHSHSEFILPLENHPEILAPFVGQGITTIVTGNCGYAPAPVNPATLEQLKSYTTFLRGADLSWEWKSFGDFLDRLDQHGVCVNVVPLAAHGPLRIHAMGFDAQSPSSDEMSEMKQLLVEAIDAGAFGLSSGLLYAPGIFTPPDELAELASVLPPDALYTSHIRGSSETLVPATRELIQVASRNGLAYEHSHLEAFGRDNWARIDKTLGLHEEARARGVDGGFDVIPYVAANTTLLAIFPPWSLEGGVDALLGRLQDPATRSAIRRSIEEDVPGWPCWIPGGWPHNLIEATGWDNVRVMWVESEKNKSAEGRSLTQLAEDRGLHPFDVAADLVVGEKGHVMALYFGVSGEEGDEACLEQIASHPFASFETDAIVTGRGVPHPAGYGAFPRVLGHFCRDRHLFPLEDAVRRITSLPAQRFGLRHRGMIRPGNFADLTIFDPETIADRTSYREPTVPPEGISQVLINGQVVLEEAGYRGHELAGQVLRRGAANA